MVNVNTCGKNIEQKQIKGAVFEATC
jgi:hypothetical protein